MKHIVVVGGGWAGLNCAYELTKSGHKVTLIEAAPQLGGRARGVNFGSNIVDNGQHIAIGAYHNLRHILQELGLDENKLFKILPLEFLAHTNSNTIRLRTNFLPHPYNLLWGVLTAENLTVREKLQILRFAIFIKKPKTLTNDCSILELLLQNKQSLSVINKFWQPIALAAMSTDISIGSAQVFLNVMHATFGKSATDCNWYLPAIDLSRLLPKPIQDFLEKNSQAIFCNTSVKEIRLLENNNIAVISNNKSWIADHIVLATPPWQTVRLLTNLPLNNLSANLNQFNYEPITTIYIQFASKLNLHYPMQGMLQTTSQWIFDRAFVAQPDMLSVVITGPTAKEDKQSLYAQILNEIQRKFPNLPQPIAYKVIQEKRAAFRCDVNTQKLRPSCKTAISNLWLCGDYIQTGLPATLEGALLSGKQTSQEILKVISPRSNQNC